MSFKCIEFHPGPVLSAVGLVFLDFAAGEGQVQGVPLNGLLDRVPSEHVDVERFNFAEVEKEFTESVKKILGSEHGQLICFLAICMF